MRMLLVILVLFSATGLLPGQEPDADAILKRARLAVVQQKQELKGEMWDRKNKTKTPIGLFLMGERIQFTYFSKAQGKFTPFEMRLRGNNWELLEMRNGKPAPFPQAKLGQAIEGTDVSYEDLAMHFLYWPKGRVLGAEKVKGRQCWKLWLPNPGRGGNYRVVHVWVEKGGGGLLKVEGCNGARVPRPVKRFLVESLQKVGKEWFVSKMTVSSLDPATGKTRSRTELNFDEPKKKRPGGLKKRPGGVR